MRRGAWILLAVVPVLLGAAPAGQVTPQLRVADTTANEKAGVMMWTITLDRPGPRTVVVNWVAYEDSSTPSDRRALDGPDFNGMAGTVMIPRGQTRVTVTVKVHNDQSFERDEWFVLRLGSPQNATIARRAATGTINDDESGAIFGRN